MYTCRIRWLSLKSIGADATTDASNAIEPSCATGVPSRSLPGQCSMQRTDSNEAPGLTSLWAMVNTAPTTKQPNLEVESKRFLRVPLDEFASAADSGDRTRRIKELQELGKSRDEQAEEYSDTTVWE